MVYVSVVCGELGLQTCSSVCWLGLCLVLGLSVCWWVCLNSRDGVSFGLFYYKFRAIPWILNYKWADNWPYWEFI